MTNFGFPVLATVMAQMAPVPCGTGDSVGPGQDRPLAVYEQPQKIRNIGLPTVLLRPDAIVAEEEFWVPIRASVTSAPIVAQKVRLAGGGRLMLTYLWHGSIWACLSRRFKAEPQATAKGPGVCVRDTDADGWVDRALVQGEEFDIDPVQLAPVRQTTIGANIRLGLVATKVGPLNFAVSGQSETITGRIPTWLFSIEGQAEAAKPWNKALKLVPGKMHNIQDLRLYMVRSGGDWMVSARGTFGESVRLCNEGTRVWIAGAQLTGG